MLDEMKQSYHLEAQKMERTEEFKALGYTSWEKIPKNTLFDLYIDTNNKDLKGYYFSAIMYHYWGHISTYYYRSQSLLSPEDCYSLLVNAVMYALDHKAWRTEGMSLYGDKYGPDKVVNQFMASRRNTAYQCANRKKRKAGFGTVSLDEISENLNDNTNVFEAQESSLESDLWVDNLITDAFNEKQYLTAFMIDAIVNADTFKDVFDKNQRRKADIDFDESTDLDLDNCVYTSEVFDMKKLIRVLKQLTPEDASYFATRYNLPAEVVKTNLIQYCTKSPEEIKRTVATMFEEIKKLICKHRAVSVNKRIEFDFKRASEEQSIFD